MERDLLFIGNASINSIGFRGQENKDVVGGAAPSAAVAASCFTESPPAVLSCLGRDYPVDQFGSAVDFSPSAYVDRTIRFDICEDTGTYSLATENYPHLPPSHPVPVARHAHLSCRLGVDIAYSLDHLRKRSFSIDVMASSLGLLRDAISQCLNDASILFCNEVELRILADSRLLPRGREILIVATSAEEVRLCAGDSYLAVPCVPIEASTIVDTVGAGDCFAGGFLAGLVSHASLAQSISWGLAAATVSLTDSGVTHLLNRREELRQLASELTSRVSLPDQSPQAHAFRNVQSLLDNPGATVV